MKNERTVGSLTCGQVLDLQPGLVDGRLDTADVARIQEHLRGCDRCERFGGVYQAALTALRDQLASAEEPSPALIRRLRTRLDEERRRA